MINQKEYIMKEFLTNIKFVWAYTKGQRLKILCVSILNIVGVFLSVVSPIIGAKVIMNITNENLSQLFFNGHIYVNIRYRRKLTNVPSTNM